MRYQFVSVWLLCLVMLSSLGRPMAARGQDAVLARAHAWNNSKVKGTPDPPLPYKATRVFSKVELDRPTDVVWVPSANKWLATQHHGKLVTFVNDPRDAVAEPFLDLSDATGEQVFNAYAVLFHPDLDRHPWCYVTFVTNPRDMQGVSLGRLRVTDPDGPTLDPTSLEVLVRWSSQGHAGGTMQFGPDGMLYFAVGDGHGPYPPDPKNTGQDLSDLQASIMRIDVTNRTAESPYRIPPDNPFVGQPNVREEIWAFGFRNPWKMAFDPESGDLLAADVGWEMREMIYRVVKGGNYGWSIMEGSQPVKQELKPTTPIKPPLFEHTHLDSRSISGGHYWQSDRIKELKGAYIYGDWMTGKVWALSHSGDQVLWQKELVDTPLQIIGFLLGPTGEVMILGYDGSIWRLEPNVVSEHQEPFPRRLSDTGIFADVVNQRPAPGVVEYQINASHWADGTYSRQWIAVPGKSQLGLFEKDNWQTGDTGGRFQFPADTVLAKTVSYLTDADDPSSQRHIETQLLHRYVDDWRAYNYIWNDEQTEALLQDDVATERKLVIKDRAAPGGQRTQTWRHSNRSECLLCHTWGVGSVHAFWPEQLNVTQGSENQLDQLAKLGLFKQSIPRKPPLPSPHDTSLPLEDRARGYLALNCATCHRNLGGGTANFNFDITKTLQQNNYLDAIPAQGSFELEDARVVAQGDPLRSVVLFRMLKTGRGHMPQFGSNVTDTQGIQLLYDWIVSMSPSQPSPTDLTRKIHQEIEVLGELDQPESSIRAMLESTPGAMALSLAYADESFGADLKSKILELVKAHRTPQIRELFEHHLPEDERVKRLGPTVDAAVLLSHTGSSEQGKELFEHAPDVNCRQCHRIGNVGKNIGPDLSGIGTQRRPDEILDSLLNPSRSIDPKYRARQILTVDGSIYSGIVLEENESSVSIADSQGMTHTFSVDDIETMQPSSKSAMPDQLLAGMTLQQAADLLAYLGEQRQIGPLQHRQTTVKYTSGPIAIDGVLEESNWASATVVEDFVFTWWNEGDPDKQATKARMLWDDHNLYVSFQCIDQDIQATRVDRDDAVYRDDCVEVFASPEFDHPERYFNLEMNALATQLDEYRPAGAQGKPIGWNPDGIQVAVTVDGTINDDSDVDQGWTLEVAIPFALFQDVLPNGRPQVGDRWRLNLNRLEANMAVKSQWSQGDRNFPRFHHPEYFGFVEFTR